MGFMDNFTSDSPVTVKQPDYYEMVKEAAKAELITNAVNAEVPGYYIQAMITGKKPDFLNTLDAEEEETGFRTEYEQITVRWYQFLKPGRKKTALRVRRTDYIGL